MSAPEPVGRKSVRISTGALRSGIQPQTLSRYRSALGNPRNRSFQGQKPALFSGCLIADRRSQLALSLADLLQLWMNTTGDRATLERSSVLQDRACAQRIRSRAGMTVFLEAPFKEAQFQTLELPE
ncbi:MAG: hypothetical protein MUC60_11640 [Oscillatoria sp. Prado101]|jgi:hypothetical protein|nr:hypothetical protein [Oscillatoria sp. Prado101]